MGHEPNSCLKQSTKKFNRSRQLLQKIRKSHIIPYHQLSPLTKTMITQLLLPLFLNSFIIPYHDITHTTLSFNLVPFNYTAAMNCSGSTSLKIFILFLFIVSQYPNTTTHTPLIPGGVPDHVLWCLLHGVIHDILGFLLGKTSAEILTPNTETSIDISNFCDVTPSPPPPWWTWI